MSAYKQRFHPWFFLPLLILLILVIVAEEDRTELADMALVVGAGLEQSRDAAELWQLTVELAYKQQNDSPGESRVISVRGDNWPELQEQLDKALDKDTYWGSAVALIVTADALSSRDSQGILRSIYLDQGINGELLLSATNEAPADIFSASFGESDYISAGLEQGLRLLAKDNKVQLVSLRDYMEQVVLEEKELALPMIALKTVAEEQQEAVISEQSYRAAE